MEETAKRGPGRPKKEESPDPLKIDTIDTMRDFQTAFTIAQQTGQDLEVSEGVFETLTANVKGPYLMMGNPTVRIFKVGTKETILAKER